MQAYRPAPCHTSTVSSSTQVISLCTIVGLWLAPLEMKGLAFLCSKSSAPAAALCLGRCHGVGKRPPCRVSVRGCAVSSATQCADAQHGRGPSCREVPEH